MLFAHAPFLFVRKFFERVLGKTFFQNLLFLLEKKKEAKRKFSQGLAQTIWFVQTKASSCVKGGGIFARK